LYSRPPCMSDRLRHGHEPATPIRKMVDFANSLVVPANHHSSCETSVHLLYDVISALLLLSGIQERRLSLLESALCFLVN